MGQFQFQLHSGQVKSSQVSTQCRLPARHKYRQGQPVRLAGEFVTPSHALLTCAHLSCCPCACPGPQAISQKCDERGAAAVAATRQTDEEEAEAEASDGFRFGLVFGAATISRSLARWTIY